MQTDATLYFSKSVYVSTDRDHEKMESLSLKGPFSPWTNDTNNEDILLIKLQNVSQYQHRQLHVLVCDTVVTVYSFSLGQTIFYLLFLRHRRIRFFTPTSKFLFKELCHNFVGACCCHYGVVPVGPGVHTIVMPGLKTGTV